MRGSAGVRASRRPSRISSTTVHCPFKVLAAELSGAVNAHAEHVTTTATRQGFRSFFAFSLALHCR